MRNVICFCTLVIFSICVNATQIESKHKLRRRFAKLLDDVDDFDNIVEPEYYQKDVYGSLSGKDDQLSQAIRKVDIIDLAGIDSDSNIKRDSDTDDSFHDTDESHKMQHRKVRTSSDLRKYENLLNLKYSGFKRHRRKRSKIKDKQKRYVNILPAQLFDKQNSYIGYLADATNDKLLKMQNYAATMMVILTTAKSQAKKDQEAMLYQNTSQSSNFAAMDNITNNILWERSGRASKEGKYQVLDPNITLAGLDRANPIQNITSLSANYPVFEPPVIRNISFAPTLNNNLQNSFSANSSHAMGSQSNIINNAASSKDSYDQAVSANAPSQLNVVTPRVDTSISGLPAMSPNSAKNITDIITSQGMLQNPLPHAMNSFPGNLRPNQNTTVNDAILQMHDENAIKNNNLQDKALLQGNAQEQSHAQLQNGQKQESNLTSPNDSQFLSNTGSKRFNITSSAEKPLRYISVNPEADVNKIAGKITFEENQSINDKAVVNSTQPVVSLNGGTVELNTGSTPTTSTFNVSVVTNDIDIKALPADLQSNAKFNTNYVTNAFAINSSANLSVDDSNTKPQLAGSTKSFAPSSQAPLAPKYRPTAISTGSKLKYSDRDVNVRNPQMKQNGSHTARNSDEDFYLMDDASNGESRNMYASDDVDDNREDKLNKGDNIPIQDEDSAQDESDLLGDEWSMSNNYKMYQLTKRDQNRNSRSEPSERRKRQSNAEDTDNFDSSDQDFRKGGTQVRCGKRKKSIDSANMINGTLLTAHIIDPRLLMNSNDVLNVFNAAPLAIVGNADLAQYGQTISLRNVIPIHGQNISLLLNYDKPQSSTAMFHSSAKPTPASNATTSTKHTTYSSKKTTSVTDNPYYWENNILSDAKIRVKKNDTIPSVQQTTNSDAKLYSVNSTVSSNVLSNSELERNKVMNSPQNIPYNNEMCQNVLQEDVLDHAKNISITTVNDEDDDFNHQKDCLKDNSMCQTDLQDEDIGGYDIVCRSTTPLPGINNASSSAESKAANSYDNVNNSSSEVKKNNADITGNTPAACAKSKFLTCANTTDEEICGGDADDYNDNACEEGIPKVIPNDTYECADPRGTIKPKVPPNRGSNLRKKKSINDNGGYRFRRHYENKVSKAPRKRATTKMLRIKVPAPTSQTRHTSVLTNRHKRLHIIPHLITNVSELSREYRQDIQKVAPINVAGQKEIIENILLNLMKVDESIDQALSPLHLAENELLGLTNGSISTLNSFDITLSEDNTLELSTHSESSTETVVEVSTITTIATVVTDNIVTEIPTTVESKTNTESGSGTDLSTTVCADQSANVESVKAIEITTALGVTVSTVETVATEMSILTTTVIEVEGLERISTLLGNVPLGETITEAISIETVTTAAETVPQVISEILSTDTAVEMSTVTAAVDMSTVPTVIQDQSTIENIASISDSVIALGVSTPSVDGNETVTMSYINSCPLFFAVKFDVNTIAQQNSNGATPPGCISFFTIPVDKINAELRKIIENLNIQNQEASGAIGQCFSHNPVNKSKLIRAQNLSNVFLRTRNPSVHLMHKSPKIHSPQSSTQTPDYGLDVNKFLSELSFEEQGLLSKLAGQLIESDMKTRSIKNVQFLPQAKDLVVTHPPLLSPTKTMIKRVLPTKSATKESRHKVKKSITKQPVKKRVKNCEHNYDANDSRLSFNMMNRLQRDLSVAKQLQTILNKVEKEHADKEKILNRHKREPESIWDNEENKVLELDAVEDEMRKRHAKQPINKRRKKKKIWRKLSGFHRNKRFLNQYQPNSMLNR